MKSLYIAENLLTTRNRLCNRRIGKTYAAIQLAEKVKGVLLVTNAIQARGMQKHNPDVELAHLYTPLTGLNKPVIIDQDTALYVIELLVKDLIHLQAHSENLIKSKTQDTGIFQERLRKYTGSRVISFVVTVLRKLKAW